MSVLQPPRQRMLNRDAVAQILRAGIADGTYAPASRLPTRIELQQQLQISPMTVQAAFDLLNDQGFIVSKGGQGTFVVDHPPNLCRYCVIFPWKPVYTPWSNYWTTIKDEALAVTRDQPRVVSIRYGVSDFESIEDYRSLEAEIREHRLAGLIFVAKPEALSRLPVWTDPRVVRAVIGEGPIDEGRIPAIAVNGQQWMEMAVDHVISQHRKRVAFLAIDRTPQSWIDRASARLAGQGIDIHPRWIQFTGMTDSRAIRNLTRLLMHGPPGERPDALIIPDDNLVPDATATLREMSLSDPQALCVVAHANYPNLTPSHVPAVRLGFDVREMVRLCFDQIDLCRRKLPGTPCTRLIPRFES